MNFISHAAHAFTKTRASPADLAALYNIRNFSSCTFKQGWGTNETEILTECVYSNTFSITANRGTWRERGRLAGGKRGGQAFPADFEWRSGVTMHQGLPGLCRGHRPFRLCHHAVLQGGFSPHSLRRATERAVARDGRGTGHEILPGHARPLQGDKRRRLRDRRVQISRRLPEWRRPTLIREAPCSRKS